MHNLQRRRADRLNVVRASADREAMCACFLLPDLSGPGGAPARLQCLGLVAEPAFALNLGDIRATVPRRPRLMLDPQAVLVDVVLDRAAGPGSRFPQLRPSGRLSIFAAELGVMPVSAPSPHRMAIPSLASAVTDGFLARQSRPASSASDSNPDAREATRRMFPSERRTSPRLLEFIVRPVLPVRVDSHTGEAFRPEFDPLLREPPPRAR